MQPVLAIELQVVVDQNAETRYQSELIHASNGVPVVNITTPNAQSLSHNKFSDYNVNQKGLILNNANSAVNTQLSGYINGNANLVNGQAAVILNEITGTSRSELRGYTEVAGQAADVIVANPNGIYVNGAGYINVPKATLTTGVPNFSGDKLNGFDVMMGQIDVDGLGFDGTNIDRVDFYAKALKLNAKVHANELHAVTGENFVATDGTATAKAGTTPTGEVFSIDATALGGIYATKIRLIGTEAGLGVNLPVEVSAQDTLEIDADGMIVLGTVAGSRSDTRSIEVTSRGSGIEVGQTLYAETVSLDAVTALTNNGVVAAKNSLTLKAEALTNNDLIASGIESDYSLTSEAVTETTVQVDNVFNNGEIFSQSDLNIDVTQTVFSKGSIASIGSVVLSADTVTIEGEDLNNRTSLLAKENVTVTAQMVDAKHATMAAGKTLAVSADAVALKSSDVDAAVVTFDTVSLDINDTLTTAASAVNVSTGTLTHTRSGLYSGGDVTMVVTGNAVNLDSSLIAVNDIHIDALEMENRGLIAAGNRLEVSAVNLKNEMNSSLTVSGVRGETVILNASDTLVNDDFMIASDVLKARTDAFENNGAIAAENRLEVEATDLTNTQTLYSGGNSDLYISGTLLNSGEEATLYAKGDMRIQADAVASKSDKIENVSGSIESEGTMHIAAKAFLNLSEAEVVKTLESITGTINFTCGDWGSFSCPDVSIPLSTDLMAIKARIVQEYEVQGITLSTEELQALLTEAMIQEDLKAYTLNMYKTTKTTAGVLYYDSMTASLSSNAMVLKRSKPHKKEQFRKVDYSVKKEVIAEEAKQNHRGASVVSGGDLMFDTDLLENRTSTIAAAGDIGLSGSIENVGITATDTISATANYSWKRKSDGGLGQLPVKKTETRVSDAVPTKIIAGGSITGHIGQLDNDSGVQEGSSVTSSNYVPPSTDASVTPPADVLTGDPLADIRMPTSPYGMFVASSDPQSNYLIESNPQYTDFSNFVGSDYFLSRIDYDNEATLKRLGDAAYETQLVREAVISLTGQRFTGEATDDNAQYVALMDNAVNMQGILDLELGEEPTNEQLSNLTEDIVWLVEREMNGQKALVPQVYLADNYGALSGALISAGESVTLDIEGDLLNSGTIKSGKDMSLAARTMLNRAGTIRAEGALQLSALDDIVNGEGGTISGAEVVLTSTGGSIHNETYTKREELQEGQSKQLLTLVSEQSRIEARDGNLVLDAKKDIVNSGAKLSAGGSIGLNAERDVVLDAVETRSSQVYEAGESFAKAETVRHVRSDVSAGEHLVVTVGNDAVLNSATVSAARTIGIDAENDISMGAVNDVAYEDVQLHSKGSFGSSKTQRDMTYKETVSSTQIDAGNIIMNAGNDINLEGTHLTAEANIIADAGNNINIAAKAYREGELHQTKKKGFAGLSTSESMDKHEALKLSAAQLRTEALNIIMSSGNDLSIIASNVESAADLELTVANNFLVASANEFKNSEEWSKEENFNILNMIIGQSSGGLIETGPVYEMELNAEAIVGSEVKSSNLVAGGNVRIDSGEATVMGSNVEAGGDLSIMSDTGSVNVLAAQSLEDIKSEHKKIVVAATTVQEQVEAAIDQATTVGETKIKVEMGSATYDKEEELSASKSHVGSKLVSGGDMTLDSIEDVTIKASNLIAEGDISLIAREGGVTIAEEVDTFNVARKETHGEAQVSVTVQNEYVELAKAWVEVAKAEKELKKAKKAYRQYQKNITMLEGRLVTLQQEYDEKVPGISLDDIDELSEIIDDIKSDEKYQIANVAAAAANLASKTTMAVQQIATAAASSGTWGFAVGMQLDVQGEKTQSISADTRSVGSSVTAENIAIATQGDKTTTVRGSALTARNDVNIDTGTLNVLASEDTHTASSKTKSIDGSVSISMYGAGGPQIGLGYGNSHADEESTTVHNSKIVAGNDVTLNVKDDANFIGANVRAENELTANVGGDLNIESKRDVVKRSSDSMNVSAGIGLSGGSTSSANASYGTSDGRTTQKTVVQSTLTGGKVDIDVSGNTDIKGATIAAGSYEEDGDFKDSGNLDLTTKTLTYKDVSNIKYASNSSFGISGGVGFNTDKATGEEKTKASTASLQLGGGMQYEKVKTLATVGQGNLKIGDTENSGDLERLNRDAENTDKDLFAVDHKKVDIDMMVDTRLLTEDGRKQIAHEYKISEVIVDSVADVVKHESRELQNLFIDMNTNLKMYEGINNKIASDPQLQEALADPNLTKAQKDVMYQEIIHAVAYELGHQTPEVVTMSTDETGKNGKQVKGHYNDGTVFMNDKKIASTKEGLNVAGHEFAHAMDHQTGEKWDTTAIEEENANLIGSKVEDYASFAAWNSGSSISDGNNHVGMSTAYPSVFNQGVRDANDKFVRIDKAVGKDAVYIYNNKVIATDGINDGKVIDLTGHEYTDYYLNTQQNGGLQPKMVSSSGLIEFKGVRIINQEDTSHYQNIFDLNNPEDFETLRQATDMNYNNINQDTRIVFENGMMNTFENASSIQQMIQKDFYDESVGLINNETGSMFGVIEDAVEWLPNTLSTKDVLNAHQLQQLSPNTVVITHSAGNEDIHKANQVNEFIEAKTPYKLISVGSPKSVTDLQESTRSVGATFVEQRNHPNDPVTIANKDADYDMTYSPLEGSVLPMKDDLNNNHPFENYYHRGVKNDIEEAVSNE
jgi:filamentous hemagglutinin family protein